MPDYQHTNKNHENNGTHTMKKSHSKALWLLPANGNDGPLVLLRISGI